jgi:mono/diheme cytochrome c family protein/uncharacterized membrane protein
MLIRHCALRQCGLAGLLVLTSLGGGQFGGPTAVHAQADSPRPSERAAGAELFRQWCWKCHGADGTGGPARNSMPDVPDFTGGPWQARRSDAQFLASILDGRGADMPAFRGKISEPQARALVAHVRAFAPSTGKSGKEKREERDMAGFDEQFRRLQEEMGQLQKEFRQLAQQSPSGVPPKPSEPRPREVSPASAPTAPGTPAVAEVFRERCGKCHGADGSGKEARSRLPDVPDFTEAAWQARRKDAQLLASILDGKGSDMPAFRGKISEEEARALVAHVRALVPTPEKPGQEEQEGTPPADPAEAKTPECFFEKLVLWLGRFHPPAVHFPIGLLTAAAVAEVLRLATGRPAFDAVSRYCVWFGAVTALVAGTLGWCVGSFRLADASWVLTAHSWLGTATVACAGVLVVLSEVSRVPGRRRTRVWFRVTLLVVALLVFLTGFFGGAVVFGLGHYAWPQ